MSTESHESALIIAAVFGGLTSLTAAFFAGSRWSRCTSVKTPCFTCERAVQDP